MATQVHDTTCRSCGAAADIGQTKCLFCKQPVLISTFNSVYSMPMPMINQYAATYREALQKEPDAKDLNNSVAMCYLKLKLYPLHIPPKKRRRLMQTRKCWIPFQKALQNKASETSVLHWPKNTPKGGLWWRSCKEYRR